MAALLDSLSEYEIFSTHKDAVAKWMNSENEIFSAHKDAVARWMDRFIHENICISKMKLKRCLAFLVSPLTMFFV